MTCISRRVEPNQDDSGREKESHMRTVLLDPEFKHGLSIELQGDITDSEIKKLCVPLGFTARLESSNPAGTKGQWTVNVPGTELKLFSGEAGNLKRENTFHNAVLSLLTRFQVHHGFQFLTVHSPGDFILGNTQESNRTFHSHSYFNLPCVSSLSTAKGHFIICEPIAVHNDIAIRIRGRFTDEDASDLKKMAWDRITHDPTDIDGFEDWHFFIPKNKAADRLGYGKQNRAQNSFLHVLNDLACKGFVLLSPYWKDLLCASNKQTKALFGDGSVGGGTAVLLQRTSSPVDGTYILLDANVYQGCGLVLEAQGTAIKDAWVQHLLNYPGFNWVEKYDDEFTHSTSWEIKFESIPHPDPYKTNQLTFPVICNWRGRQEDDHYLLMLAHAFIKQGALFMFRFGTKHDMLFFMPNGAVGVTPETFSLF